MKVPISWLREYVSVELPAHQLAHRLTMAGTEVASIEKVGSFCDLCVVALVEKVEPHPNADRLRLCTVDLGNVEHPRVVCGAPNVAEGQKVAFAGVGAQILDSSTRKQVKIRATQIRGVASEGMICSEQELGLGEDNTGILVLPDDFTVGAHLSEYLGDTVLDLEVNSNRPDCLSLLGIAYEVAALTGASVQEPELGYSEDGASIFEQVKVDVRDQTLCPRYTMALITNVNVGPSPRWMQERLTRAGMRPINNVVDITNYVMLEYGQPLHAFDFTRLNGHEIVVRPARRTERMTSLDGQEHELESTMLVISAGNEAIGLAGVIGAANSEVSESTTQVLLESASFDPFSTRKTATDLHSRTEASARFEKGLRIALPPIALRRAIRLLVQLAGGVVARGIIDTSAGGSESLEVGLSQKRLHQVLGMALPIEQITRVLTALGFVCRKDAADSVRASVPYWRSDVTIEDDLIEEVVRVIGYDQAPTTMLSTPLPYHRPAPGRELKERVLDLLTSAGMQEIITYSVISGDFLRRVQGVSPNEETVLDALRVANPLTPAHEYLRTSLYPGLLASLAANYRREEGPIRLFEVGNVYLPREGDLPNEKQVAAGVFAGPSSEPGWLQTGERQGFFEAKGVIDEVLSDFGLTAGYTSVVHPPFQIGRAASITVGEALVGMIGEVDQRVLEFFGIEGEAAALFSLDLEELLLVVPTMARSFQPFPRFPEAERDIALVMDIRVPAQRVYDILKQHPLVAKVHLFDVYVGDQVPEGKRSLAYRLVFQSSERTLNTKEINDAVEELFGRLQRDLEAERR